jgi:hypothetical protein
MNFDIDQKILKKSISEKIDSKSPDSLLCVNVLECYYPMWSLKEYLDKNIKNMTLIHWKVLLFQIFYVLHKLNEKFKKFRHNMLNLESIRVYETDKSTEKTRIKLGDITFEIPHIGFEIRLTDYDKSSTSDYNKSHNIQENPYYDIHYFAQSLLFYFNDKVPDILKDIFDEILPLELRTHNENEFKGLNEKVYSAITKIVQTPLMILKKNNFFTEFIKESINSMDLSVSPMENKIENIEQYKNKEIMDESQSAIFSSATDPLSNEPLLLAKKVSKKNNNILYNSSNKNSYKNNKNMERVGKIFGSKKTKKVKKTIKEGNDQNKYDISDDEEKKVDDDDDDDDEEKKDNDEEEDEEEENIEEGAKEIKRLGRNIMEKSALSDSDASKIADNHKVKEFLNMFKKDTHSETSTESSEEKKLNISSSSTESDKYDTTSDESDHKKYKEKLSRTKKSVKKQKKVTESSESDHKKHSKKYKQKLSETSISSDDHKTKTMSANTDMSKKILDMLPEGYTGILPDKLANMLQYPDLNNQQQFMAPQVTGIGKALDSISKPDIGTNGFGSGTGMPSSLGSAGFGNIPIHGFQQPTLQNMNINSYENQNNIDPNMLSGLQNLPPNMPPEMHPGMMNPGMMNPGMMNPSMMNPGMMNPGMMNPGMMNPGMMNPGMMNPGMMNPGIAQYGGNTKIQKKYKFSDSKTKEKDFFF